MNTAQPLPALLSMSSVDHIRERFETLKQSDAQFRDALPLASVAETKCRPELGLAQVVATCLEAYAARPALAERATRWVTDPATGRTRYEHLESYRSVSYAELWERSRALAALWYEREADGLRANDFLCIIAFAGIDFATVDLAAMHNGAVVVPLQTNAPTAQLIDIVKEVEPRWLATSLECLPTAVDLVLNGHQPAGVLVFNYHPQADEERESFDCARTRLEAAGLGHLLITLDAACERGRALPAAPLYAEPSVDQRLCTIYYTSGSTGLPKGAMYPEAMVKPIWRTVAPIPLLLLHYMPMNHSFGRSGVFQTLGSGGTVYFTAKSDLSELFDDMRRVRPTFMSIVPRLCEMIYQRYQVEVERRAPGASDLEALKRRILLEFREQVLGGRLLNGPFGSAPLAPELREFMESVLGFALDDNYGTTEISGAVRNTRVLKPPVVDYQLEDVPELGYFKTDKPYPRGELLIKTRSIMLGYFKRPDATAAVIDAAGYYRTGDIMAEIGPDRLVYVDRRNNVLKLAQGEFVAISRLEALYTNGHAAIRQVYLYGTSERSYLVGVVVPNEETLRALHIAPPDVKAVLRDALKEVARAEQLAAFEVPRDFIVEYEPFSVANGLLAGIGKYQRPKFKARYGAALEKLYEDIAATQAAELAALRSTARQAPVLETVLRAVQATLGVEAADLSSTVCFADLGGDSLSALACSVLLEDIYDIEVPAGVINNPAGSLQQVAQYIERARASASVRPTFASVHGRRAMEIRAGDLTLDRFLDQATLQEGHKAAPPAKETRTVVVTGATGYLGRFLCLEWLQRMAAVDGRVIAIARGKDPADARQRIAAAYDSDDAQLSSRFESLARAHLEVLPGDLAERDLGLAPERWRALAETVDLIVHPAAFVNHVLPYPQLFGANVVGTAELIRLAITGRLKPFNNVSTVAAAMIPGQAPIDEDLDVRAAMPVRRLNGERYADGYANSKWAGEVLLRDAHERFGLPVSVFRSDMILAHSRYRGQINVPDMFTRWLYSILATGLAPRSFYTDGARPHYDGLPVDFTAAAVATLGAHAVSGFSTYHVVNPHDDGISLDSFVDWAIAAGHPIRRIDDYADWYRRFETALRALPDKRRHQSSLALLHSWQRPMAAHAGAVVAATRFRAAVRRYGVGAERDIPHLSREFILKYLDDLKHLQLL
jgi:fatty acid CoA ligase FadD9